MDLIRLSLICFGGGGGYRAPAPVATPEDSEAEVKAASEAAAEKEKELAKKRKGRRSMIKTSPLGLSDDSAVTRYGQLIGNKTKLGG